MKQAWTDWLRPGRTPGMGGAPILRAALIGLIIAPTVSLAGEVPRPWANQGRLISSGSTDRFVVQQAQAERRGQADVAAPLGRNRPLPDSFKSLDIGAAPFPTESSYLFVVACAPDELNRVVGEALVHARTGSHVRVALPADCTFRESLSIRGPIAGSIEIAAPVGGATIISGADVFDEWTRSGDVWSSPWPFDFGLTWPKSWPARLPQNEVLKRVETFFVNDNRLRQVDSRHDLDAQTFFVDEGKNEVVIRTPINLDRARVEGTVRRQVISLHSTNNVAIRGIVVRHGASSVREGSLVVRDSKNILLEDLIVAENSGKGIWITESRAVTVRRTRVHDNGYSCLAVGKTVGLLAEDVTCLRSNWRGYPYGLVGWDPAGAKFVRLHNAIFRNFVSKGNLARGFWLDHDIKNILIDDAEWSENRAKDGAFFEKVAGPVIVRGLTVRNNSETGIRVSAAQNITIQDGLFEGNPTQIRFSGSRDAQVQDFETGEVHTLNTDHWVLTRNTFGATREEVIANGRNPPLQIRSEDNFCRSATKSAIDSIVCE